MRVSTIPDPTDDTQTMEAPLYYTSPCPEGFCAGSALQDTSGRAAISSRSMQALAIAGITLTSELNISAAAQKQFLLCQPPRMNSPDNVMCGECENGQLRMRDTSMIV